MGSAANGGRPGVDKAFLFVGIIAIGLVIALGAGQTVGLAPGHQTGNPAPASHGDPTNAGSPGVIDNSTPCGLFDAMYNSSASFLPYYANFSYMFSQLCQTPQFVAIYEGMGPSGFFAVGWGGTIGALPNLSFSLYWQANCTNISDGFGSTQCTHQADWIGNLTTNTVTGPFVREYPVICMCGVVLVKSPPPAGSILWLPLAVLGIGVAIGSIIAVAARRRGPPPRPPRGR
jgi:hypothetical protein